MKLSIYLLKATVNSFEQPLKPQSQTRHYHAIRGNRMADDFDYEVFLVETDPKRPKWLNFIEHYVEPTEIANLFNQTQSMLILLRVETTDGIRHFAISGTHGYHILNKNYIESNFGLKTALNTMDHEKIKLLDSRSIGVQTRQIRQAYNMDTSFGEFDFEFDADILRIAHGACADESIGTRIGGSDSLHLTTQIEFAQLGQLCHDVYDKYKLETYKDHFEFIDYIKHEKDTDQIALLDQQLVGAINARQNDLKISVACPDLIDYERAAYYRISGFRRSDELEEISLTGIYNFLASDQVTISDLKNTIKIIGIDDDQESPCTPLESMYAYMTYEAELNSKKYVLSNRNWYEIETSYLNRLEEQLSHRVNFCSDPELKIWFGTQNGSGKMEYNEGKYNDEYKDDPDYLYLDKNFFTFGPGSGRSKIEIADLYHLATNKAFCVKKLTRSSTLSHLFSQATVSAELIKEESAYRGDLLTAIQDKWPGVAVDDNVLNRMTFVYAIATDKQEELRELLPIFSKINLVKHIKMLNKMNFSVELVKIRLVEAE